MHFDVIKIKLIYWIKLTFVFVSLRIGYQIDSFQSTCNLSFCLKEDGKQNQWTVLRSHVAKNASKYISNCAWISIGLLVVFLLFAVHTLHRHWCDL